MPLLQFLRFWHTVLYHVKAHVGMGIVCAVAYFDPGNWSVDLQAGSSFGYRPMLFVVLMAGLGAIVLQTLSCKLGCVTGLDLAAHCRILLHDHPKHPLLVRRLILYPLYVLSEVAIIATDLAELLGSAIGICLIFPSLPLWAGVVITALDVFLFLLISDPTHKHSRLFEMVVIVLVVSVFACFIVLIVKVKPDWPGVFMGYIPSKALFKSDPDAVYSAVGILGATVMPHALFLGSFMATQDRRSPALCTDHVAGPELPLVNLSSRVSKGIRELFAVSTADKNIHAIEAKRENHSPTFIQQHLKHEMVDVISSLLFLAVPINSAILIMAATVFYSESEPDEIIMAGLFDAHDLIKARIGKGAAFVFALALISAGQTSGITATLAGQIVSQGFINWGVSPFLRRLLTRALALVPSVVVAIAVGRAGIDSLLVVSQVILSVVLPFVAFPLIWLTSSRRVMRVEGGQDHSNGWILAVVAYGIWGVVLVANSYGVVSWAG
ncbi:natural resistance-associated macrophage protein [Guyanagaster necrorhizus]|uniref:Natural resistance-associated macrophage protein n=1 Tax=Guyanagaster necrorhizus TaxID=856835 RepID=A0A9P8AWD5_9AGAR|nr:natural resistance-associated macrophage protein [Guyanagaster necrorhizus MCA 3950]KAG7450215.1 natural resistance-associated macrophage protein [Guyanagaster necrorhizus MCA 3950]